VAAATYEVPRETAEWFAENVVSVDMDSFYRFALGEFTRLRSLHYALLISNYIYYEDRKASLGVKLPSRVAGGVREYCRDLLPVLRACFGKYGSDLYVDLLRTSLGISDRFLYANNTVGKLKGPGKTLVVSPYDMYTLYKHLSEVGLDHHALYELAGAVRAQCGEGCSGEAAALELVGTVLGSSWGMVKDAEEVMSSARLPEEDYALIERAASYATWTLGEAREAAASGDIERVRRIVSTPMEFLRELTPSTDDYWKPITMFSLYLNRRAAPDAASAKGERDHLGDLRRTAMKIAALRAIAEVMKSLIQPDGRIWR